jgi:hypothetical protein
VLLGRQVGKLFANHLALRVPEPWKDHKERHVSTLKNNAPSSSIQPKGIMHPISFGFAAFCERFESEDAWGSHFYFALPASPTEAPEGGLFAENGRAWSVICAGTLQTSSGKHVHSATRGRFAASEQSV